MSRRADIADAAIRTLARDGMRGLTHRAVDRAAGLPDGSVSYYFRTRRALLQATLERLVELDITDMLASPGIPAQPGRGLDAFADTTAIAGESWLTAGRERQLARYELTLEATRRPELRHALVAAGAEIRAMVARQFAAAAASLVESWLTTGRERQLARYELALEATRRPELRQALVASGAAIRAVVASQFAAAGIREPRSRAADFVAFLDGLVFDQTAGAGARNLTRTDLRAAIGALLAAVTGLGEAAVADGLS